MFIAFCHHKRSFCKAPRFILATVRVFLEENLSHLPEIFFVHLIEGWDTHCCVMSNTCTHWEIQCTPPHLYLPPSFIPLNSVCCSEVILGLTQSIQRWIGVGCRLREVCPAKPGRAASPSNPSRWLQSDGFLGSLTTLSKSSRIWLFPIEIMSKIAKISGFEILVS